MSFLNKLIPSAAIALTISSCNMTQQPVDDFDYTVDRFADIEVLRYKVPGFEALSTQQKALIYHLTEAAIAGRDILWDQNGKYNLRIRQVMEQIYTNYAGDKNSDEFKAFEKYLKLIWFANGIHRVDSRDL